MFKKSKPFILPIALLLGLLLHDWAAMFTWIVPYLVFCILLLNFTAVDVKRLSIGKLDWLAMAFQTVVSIAAYYLTLAATGNDVLAQGTLICILCPVASAVVVIVGSMGGNRHAATTYTIYGNILVAIVAPAYFSLVCPNAHLGFAHSWWVIFSRIAPSIALPYFIVLLLQHFAPKVNKSVARYCEWALPVWALALLITLGTTIDKIFLNWQDNELTIIGLGVIAIAACALQYAVGYMMGGKLGLSIAGRQVLGQKNAGIGIWMAFTFLNPLTTVALAFYSIAQNVYNSYQMWRFAQQKK